MNRKWVGKTLAVALVLGLSTGLIGGLVTLVDAQDRPRQVRVPGAPVFPWATAPSRTQARQVWRTQSTVLGAIAEEAEKWPCEGDSHPFPTNTQQEATRSTHTYCRPSRQSVSG